MWLVALLSCEHPARLTVRIAPTDGTGDLSDAACGEASWGTVIHLGDARVGTWQCGGDPVEIPDLLAGESAKVVAETWLYGRAEPIRVERRVTLEEGHNAVTLAPELPVSERVVVRPTFGVGEDVDAIEVDLSPEGAACADGGFDTAGGDRAGNCERVDGLVSELVTAVTPGRYTWAVRGYHGDAVCWSGGGTVDVGAEPAGDPVIVGAVAPVADPPEACLAPLTTVIVDPIACAGDADRLPIDDLTLSLFADGSDDCVTALLDPVADGPGQTCAAVPCAADLSGATRLRPGDYRLELRARSAGTDCLTGEAEFTVPVSGDVAVHVTEVEDAACRPAEVERLADSAAEFSGTQGQDGWSYGYYATLGDPSSFTEFDTYRADNSWGRYTSPWWAGIWDVHMHPYLSGEPDVVRRWVSDHEGFVHVTGEAFDRDPSCGDGQYVELWTGGFNFVENHVVDTTPVPLDLYLSVTVGQPLDFVVTYGFNDACDSTTYTVIIDTAPGYPYGP